MNHLKQLADAGLTHVHLLPSYDFGSVDEVKENWKYVGKDSGMCFYHSSNFFVLSEIMLQFTAFSCGYRQKKTGDVSS